MIVTATPGTPLTTAAIWSAARPCNSLPCGEKLRPGKITVTCAPGSSASRRTRPAADLGSLRPGHSTNSSGTPRSSSQAARFTSPARPSSGTAAATLSRTWQQAAQLGTGFFKYLYTAKPGADTSCPNTTSQWLDASPDGGTLAKDGNILAPDSSSC